MKQCKYNARFFNRDLANESPMPVEYARAIEKRKQYLEDYPFASEFPTEKLARKYLDKLGFEETRKGVFEGECDAYLNKVSNVKNHKKLRQNYYLISYI